MIEEAGGRAGLDIVSPPTAEKGGRKEAFRHVWRGEKLEMQTFFEGGE